MIEYGRGSVLRVAYPGRVAHVAIVLDATSGLGPICAVGTSGDRPEPRYRIDWDQPPAATWIRSAPRGTTNFYTAFFALVPRPKVLERLGRVPSSVVGDLLDLFGRHG